MHRTLVSLFFPLSLILLALTPAEPASAAKRVALVIGNGSYTHATELKNPKNDADRLAAVLERLDFEVIKGVDLERSAFETTVRRFARAVRGADVALLFYAGHGLQVDGRNYLVPIDAKLSDEADLDFEALSLRTILKQMEREARTNIVFLDACRDNPLARNLARSMGTRSAAIGRGLARVDTGIGTLIAFATEPGNVSLDGDGDNSPFTTALLTHIETAALDVAQLMRRVRVDVMRSTASRQVPWTNSSLTGDFYFAGPKPPADEPAQASASAPPAAGDGGKDGKPNASASSGGGPATLDTRAIDLAFWNSISGSKSAEDYKDYLRRFPDGIFASLAKRRAERLGTQQAALTPPKPPAPPRADAVRGAGTHTIEVELGKGATREGDRPWLGVTIHKVDGDLARCWGLVGVDGVFIAGLIPGGPAREAGLRPGDVVQRIDSETIDDARELARVVAAKRIGQTVRLSVLRSESAIKGVANIEKRANSGDGVATFCMGLIHHNAWGVVQDRATALDWFRKASDKGDANATYNVGYMYANGYGTGRDLAEAARWYRKAADKGNAGAMLNLARFLYHGQGVAKDMRESARLFERAAEKGDVASMSSIGHMYDHGLGVGRDFRKAATWYRKAADKGDADAMNNLGVKYERGEGVPRDAREAVDWYRKSAEAGNGRAMANLGIMYENGKGVAKDMRAAVEWYFKASETNDASSWYLLAHVHNDGAGVARDPKKAAEYMLKALKGGNDYAIKQMTTNAAIWQPGFRTELQRLMQREGVYSGAIDGKFGSGTRRAVEALAKR